MSGLTAEEVRQAAQVLRDANDAMTCGKCGKTRKEAPLAGWIITESDVNPLPWYALCAACWKEYHA